MTSANAHGSCHRSRRSGAASLRHAAPAATRRCARRRPRERSGRPTRARHAAGSLRSAADRRTRGRRRRHTSIDRPCRASSPRGAPSRGCDRGRAAPGRNAAVKRPLAASIAPQLDRLRVAAGRRQRRLDGGVGHRRERRVARIDVDRDRRRRAPALGHRDRHRIGRRRRRASAPPDARRTRACDRSTATIIFQRHDASPANTIERPLPVALHGDDGIHAPPGDCGHRQHRRARTRTAERRARGQRAAAPPTACASRPASRRCA